jgi:putative ATP-dependent endonuclease of OLD family
VAKTYVKKPASKKRFESDYSHSEMAQVVQRKKDRAEGGNTIVCVSDSWTLEYDLALYGCAKLMYLAIALAIKANSRDERLEEIDEKVTLAAAELDWAILQVAGHTDEVLAAIIYKPLQMKEASKAIAAQYAAELVSKGLYGKNNELFNKLPPYLQTGLRHLTSDPLPTSPKSTGSVSANNTPDTTTVPVSSTISPGSATNGG